MPEAHLVRIIQLGWNNGENPARPNRSQCNAALLPTQSHITLHIHSDKVATGPQQLRPLRGPRRERTRKRRDFMGHKLLT